VKLRHAAAFALVGWYLMLPPADYSNWQVNPKAPLSEWVVNLTADSATECENRREVFAQVNWTPTDTKKHEFFHALFQDSQCVATDDPRLKGN
jgi:hypothetical protein